jgi:hypothetical protein
MLRTDLLQVDTYRMTDDIPSLNTKRKWRSALVVLVDHEVQEFINDDLFRRLISDKWNRFGCRMYIMRTVIPYLGALGCLLAVGHLRGGEVQSAWPYIPQLEGQSASVLCIQDANFSSSSALFSWIQSSALPGGGHSVEARIATLLLELGLVFCVAPFLLWKGWRQRRLRVRDMVSNGENRILAEEALLFVQKNLHFLLDVVGAGLIAAACGARAMCQDSAELMCLAVASIVLCFNLINVLMPFRLIGELVVTMYKILRGDVAHFLCVYAILLVGFSWGIYLLFQRLPEMQGCELRADGCADAPAAAMFSGVGQAMLWLIWSSLGDNLNDVPVCVACRSFRADIESDCFTSELGSA